jgi:hypothetical protein
MGTRDEKTGAEREAAEFSEDTGYTPSVNQRRHEPLPASRHDERPQEAVVRNEEHAGTHTQTVPSRRGRRRDDGERDDGQARREG